VKVRAVVVDNRKARLELWTRSGEMLPFPFSRLRPRPTRRNRIREAFVDPELGREGVTYVLESGAEGVVHIDHALEYNEDPGYLSEMLMHRMTVEATKRIASAGLSRREIARRLGTSVPQLYRLLDPTNSSKSINQLISLLHVLGCEVDVKVKRRRVAA
jgi:predicted XRE-type DNA-binding protein